jgi:hypothetical protein
LRNPRLKVDILTESCIVIYMNNTATPATARLAETIEADLAALGALEPYAIETAAECLNDYRGQLAAFGDGTGRNAAVKAQKFLTATDALFAELRRCSEFGPFLPYVEADPAIF